MPDAPDPREHASEAPQDDADPPGSSPTADPGHESPEAELAELNDRLLRALAEAQNRERRMRQEHEDAVRFAAAGLAEDLIQTLDDLGRAVESATGVSAPDVAAQLRAGVEATQRNLLATLARHGVEKIDPLGAAFDPHRHHAVAERPGPPEADGTVVEVLRPGYAIHGRLLRPAMVGVAVAGR